MHYMRYLTLRWLFICLYIFSPKSLYIDIRNGLFDLVKIVTLKEKHFKADLFNDEGIKPDILEMY